MQGDGSLTPLNGNGMNGSGVNGFSGDEHPHDAGLVYCKDISQSLRERVKRYIKKERDLDEELALLRMITHDCVVAYDAVLELLKKVTDPGKRMQLLSQAGALVTGAANQVRDMELAIHRISQGNDGMYSPAEVQQLLYRALKIFDVHLGRALQDPVNLDVNAFTLEVKNALDTVVDATSSTNGQMLMTTLEPADQEAEAMDDTVPASPDEAVA